MIIEVLSANCEVCGLSRFSKIKKKCIRGKPHVFSKMVNYDQRT